MNVYTSSASALIRSFNLNVLMLAAFLICYDVLAACMTMYRKLHVRITREIMILRRFCPLLLCYRYIRHTCYVATLFSVLHALVHLERRHVLQP